MEPIETPRLVLRLFSVEDTADIHPLFCDQEAMRLVGMLPAFEDMEQTRERLTRWSPSERRLAVVLKETGRVIGYLAVNPDSEEGREDTREIGFALHAADRGHGYMREAVEAMLAALRTQGIRFVWACCFTENRSSEQLIRRLGFAFQKQGRYTPPNDHTYDSLEFRLTL